MKHMVILWCYYVEDKPFKLEIKFCWMLRKTKSHLSIPNNGNIGQHVISDIKVFYISLSYNVQIQINRENYNKTSSLWHIIIDSFL